jgi:hypothetical protein
MTRLPNIVRMARLAVLAALPLCAFAQASTASYSLREADPGIGSNVRREIGASSLPLGRPYGELSADERADVRSASASLAAGDEPPFAVDGFKSLPELLSRIQARLKISGELALLVQIDAQGDAQSVSVLKSPNADLQAIVGKVLIETRYKPAMCAGSPCAKDLTVTFTLHR